jgi:hypothetical protein
MRGTEPIVEYNQNVTIFSQEGAHPLRPPLDRPLIPAISSNSMQYHNFSLISQNFTGIFVISKFLRALFSTV